MLHEEESKLQFTLHCRTMVRQLRSIPLRFGANWPSHSLLPLDPHLQKGNNNGLPLKHVEDITPSFFTHHLQKGLTNCNLDSFIKFQKENLPTDSLSFLPVDNGIRYPSSTLPRGAAWKLHTTEREKEENIYS